MIRSASSEVFSINGDQLYLYGSGLSGQLRCEFYYRVKTGPAKVGVAARLLSSSVAECNVPRSPYRIILHHQHRLPWPGCTWDERCMANTFTMAVHSEVSIMKNFTFSYYYGNLSEPIYNDVVDSQNFQNHLYALNHPADCSNVPVLLMKNPTHNQQCTGIGMVFYSHYITALKEAYEQGRALVLKDSFLSYCYFSDRKTDSERYVLPPSNCSLQEVNMSLATEFKAGAAWFSSIAKPLHLKAKSLVWFRSNLLKYLFRYTPSFHQHLTNVVKMIKFEKPCIGVHLRRGERGNVGFTTVWLAEYPLFDMTDAMRLLREVKNRTGINTIVLATDEPTFFKEIPRYSSEFNIIFDTFYKRPEKGRDCIRETIAGCTPGINASSVVKTILTEIYLLSQCQVYAGTLTSTFSKLAVDYLVAEQEKSIVVSLE